MNDPYIGQMLENRYEILELIGIGGMSSVYKAKCHRLNRLVAVKILRSDLARDADFRRRFNAESQAIAQLSSPNIVQVYDVSKGGDLEYIVMELIDGITLKQYMEKRGRLNWRESLHFITQIMRGLAHAHGKGIIHRDIKPQNIMILRDGSVKVADFGIACLENAAQTLTQQALGSVHYISPEQARGDHIDARSDIYSAGIVLYEMLTGRLPFDGDSAVSVAIQHLSAVPPTPRSIDPDIPDQLELICMKAMAQEPDLRYPSAEAMIQDLEAFRKDPEASLDFQMADIRPPVPDEPAQPVREAPNLDATQTVGTTQRRRQTMRRQEEDAPRNVAQIALVCAAGFLGVLLAVVLIRGILNSFVRNDPQEQHMVRSVVGYTISQARELEGVNGIFEIVRAGDKPSEQYAPGVIVEQDPSENSYRKGNNLIIRVWVSSGEETAKMPDVVDQTVSQAEKVTLADLIERYSLTVEAGEEYDEATEAGHIVSSEPQEGGVLRRGDTIRLIVSKGAKPPATWPLTYFVGMKLDQVLGQLKNLGLTRGSVDYEHSDEPEGTIISQDPPAQTQVSDGAKVSFVVSKGPEPNAQPVEAPEPEPEPEPEPAAPKEKSLELVIPLPSEGETGYMEILQDGKRIETGTVDFNTGTYSMEITATGQTVVTVYMDQERLYSETIDMETAGDRYILRKNDAPASDGGQTETSGGASNPDSGATGNATNPDGGETAQTGPRVGEDGKVYPLDPEDEPGYQDPSEKAANDAIGALLEALFGGGGT